MNDYQILWASAGDDLVLLRTTDGRYNFSNDLGTQAVPRWRAELFLMVASTWRFLRQVR